MPKLSDQDKQVNQNKQEHNALYSDAFSQTSGIDPTQTMK
jgi:hypothetical protein